MVARTQQRPGDLIVSFSRRGLPLESILCANGDRAAEHAIHMISKNQPLVTGDLLFVRRDGEVGSWPDDRFSDFGQEGGS